MIAATPHFLVIDSEDDSTDHSGPEDPSDAEWSSAIILAPLASSTHLPILSISKNNPWRQVRPLRLAHIVHITSTANHDATTYTNYHWAQLAQHHIFRASPGATLYLQGVTGAPPFLPGTS